LAGELDLSTAAELRRRLISVVESGDAATVVLDLSDVTYIDASGAGLIVKAWSTAKGRGRQLRAEGLRGLPAQVFGLLGLDSMLACRTRESATRGHASDR
jgi:anti-sigma B factor antagonist